MNPCPCGSDASYDACCEPIIKGKKAAATAEQLMRARYTAHEKVEVDFIFASTHPDYRDGYDHKGTRAWAESAEWLGLDILDTSAGGPDDKEGEVEFIARFRNKGGLRKHHERGHFLRKRGKWLFTEGQMVKSAPVSVSKTGRNEPCPCGSGKKFKKCCG